MQATNLSRTHFHISDAPSDADINRCIHCGLCLNYCPTYRLTGLETESPRGRLFLMRKVAEGKQEVNAQFEEHIGLCLGCRNCETVCPSGVRFGHLFESARAEIVTRGEQSVFERAMRWIIFKQIWQYPNRLNLLVGLISFYQRVGLQRLLRASGILKSFGRLGELEALLPTRRLQHFFPSPSTGEGQGEGRSAALFTGCIMRAGFSDIHDATIRVLERSGYRVAIPENQICCAALHIHAGEREMAKQMARRNIDAFTREGERIIVVNAAGCGAVLKEYAELLQNDPAYAERARKFSARVKDISEIISKREPFSESNQASTVSISSERFSPKRVTYQEPCHLAHAQRIKQEPREILRQIPGIELIEMRASDRCCGSAGIYNVLHPEIADQLIDEKMENIAATGAKVVVTGNIGCLLQLEFGKARSGWKGRVMHLVELVDEAYKQTQSITD